MIQSTYNCLLWGNDTTEVPDEFDNANDRCVKLFLSNPSTRITAYRVHFQTGHGRYFGNLCADSWTNKRLYIVDIAHT